MASLNNATDRYEQIVLAGDETNNSAYAIAWGAIACGGGIVGALIATAVFFVLHVAGRF